MTNAACSAHCHHHLLSRARPATAWKKDETQKLMKLAIHEGFRAFDTANMPKHYNESLVGAALQEALSDPALALTRDEFWIQTKFSPDACRDQEPELHPYNASEPPALRVRQSLASSLHHLHVKYLDSLLLHAPYSSRTETLEAWQEMERIHHEGAAREIGVSNFNFAELKWLLSEAKVPPAFVQNRCLNKDDWDREVRQLCAEAGIRYQGFWLLTGNRHITSDRQVIEIAARHGKTPQQVLFRFLNQAFDMMVLSGTRNTAHMAEDLEVQQGTFDLAKEDIDAILSIKPPKFTSQDPVKVAFKSLLEEEAHLYWIDNANAEVHNGKIGAGADLQVDTFHSHEFVVRVGTQAVLRWRAEREHGETQTVHVDRKLKAEFANVGASPLRVFWQGPDSEVLQGELHATGKLEVDTFLQHKFVARSFDGALVHEWEAAADAPGKQRVELKVEL
eukprot:TRINITY_DN27208_c0_g1_i1.p1 TRINITY_DN27208_c0_g1~~TRINITY_DN27208_c0_g1_i1.p1  ORF type:complete len:458 (-),score=111.24 TRINITY_DN27208_c0_g1_i1:34-1380(-)